MEFGGHCKGLEEVADIVCDEIKHATRMINNKDKELTDYETRLICQSFAAAISQLNLLRLPLAAEAISLEMEATKMYD